MAPFCHLFCELTPQQLDAIVAQHFAPATLSEARLLPGGWFNTTYSLQLSDGQRLVLRAGPINRHLLMPHEHGMMRAEAHVYDLCHARGIPVSHVRALSTDHAIVDRDYMIVDYIPSTALSELQLDPEDKARVYCELGDIMRRMHGITGERYGRVALILSGGGYATWRAAVLGEIDEWATRPRLGEIYAPHEVQAVLSLFERFAPLMDAITVPQLAHTDMWAGNVLVAGEGADCHVAAMIDPDRALFGDPAFEFADGLGQNADFMRGYGAPVDASRDGSVRRRLYALTSALLNSYVWLVQYDDTTSSSACRNRAMELLSGLQAE